MGRVAKRQHRDAQVQQLLIQCRFLPRGFPAEDHAARGKRLHLLRRRVRRGNSGVNLLCAQPPGNLHREFIRIVEDQNHVLHAILLLAPPSPI